MAHSICTPGAGGESPYVQRLWQTLLASNIDSKSRIEQLFDHETAEFDLNYAFLSYIDLTDETERFDITHGAHEVLKPGTTIPLSKSYCRKTIADPEGTLAVSDAIAEGWGDDPAYETWGVGSYLGTTVSVDDELYGTLCFANTAPRDDPIRDEEKALIEMHGGWVEYTLETWEGPPIRKRSIDTIEKRAVSSEAINSMMDVLRKPTRRVILMTLLDDTTQTTISTLEREINDENARTRLRHSSLPILDNAGYIEWDEDAETVSKGPKFPEVEPLVQLLKEYNTMFPE